MLATEETQETAELKQYRELVHRIVATASFQRSARLRDLLLYLVEQSLSGHSRELTENQIGRVVFGKSVNYSPVEDSSVRVHVRQLRLKLHEYFDGEGRGEPFVIEIPKGGYSTVFRAAAPLPAAVMAPVAAPAEVRPEPVRTPVIPSARGRFLTLLPWALLCLAAIAYVTVGRQGKLLAKGAGDQIPWPLSSVFDSTHRTYIVLADSNYGMLRIIGQRPGSMEDYLAPEYPKQFLPADATVNEARLLRYISASTLTSYADVVAATTLMNRTHSLNSQTLVRAARTLSLRDLEQGNFVFIGSPDANPWVLLFQDKLNFQGGHSSMGEGAKHFENMHPLPGEQRTYEGISHPGESGYDYASIALLPGLNGRGQVLIVQGLQQEGTEAAAEFLGNPESLRQLQDRLGLPEHGTEPVSFEALIRTTTLAGMPNSTEIVAVRRIH
jgi:hypothetical protein